MSNRFNETNNTGFITLNGNVVLPAQNYTDQYQTEVSGGGAVQAGGVAFYSAITVTSNGHAVERGGDLGLYDTVSNVPVRTDQCTFGPGQNANSPNT